MRLRAMGVAWVLAAALRQGAAADGELFPVAENGKWGYIDRAGKVAIPLQYEAAWDFAEGLACVQVGLLRGFIDAKNTMVIKPQYFVAGPFSEGLAAVYADAQPWGAFMVFNRDSGNWMYIDKAGQIAVTPKQAVTAAAGEFRGGVARVVFQSAKSEGLLNRAGELVGSRGFRVGRCAEGLVAFEKQKGKCGYVDSAGKEAIPADFEAGGDFSEGLARVRKGGKWGFIGKTGQPAFEGQYEEAGDFAGGLAPVAVEPPAAPDGKPGATAGKKPAPKWGCIDKTGKLAIQPQFDFVASFSEGLARTVVNVAPAAGAPGQARHGYMDRSGKTVIEPKFDVGWDFTNGLARVMFDGKLAYIGKDGKFVWEPKERMFKNSAAKE